MPIKHLIGRGIGFSPGGVGFIITHGLSVGEAVTEFPSDDFKAAAFAENTGEAFLVLITISHPDLVTPIRATSDGVDTLSRGVTYDAYPFDITLPDSREGALPSGRLQIDNIHQDITAAIRAIRDSVECTIEVVLGSNPDQVERSFPKFELDNADWNVLLVQGDLVLPQTADEPYSARRFTPNDYPGLYA